MKKHLYIFASVVMSVSVWGNSALAQTQAEPFTFTQYMNNLIPINAAYSTIDDAANINLVGRKQFIGIDGAPNTFLFNGAVPITNIGSTAGLIVNNDAFGAENITEINAFFAKKIQLSGATYLSAAVNAGFLNHKVNTAQLAPSDPLFGSSNFNTTQTNVGLSVMLYGSDYYVGLSLPHLTLKNIGQSQAQNGYYMNSYYLTAAHLIPLGDDFKIKPAALIAYAGNNLPVTFDASATVYVKSVIGLGVNYHNANDAMAGILTVFINNNIQFGYSYQFSVGQYALGGINNTTQELTLSYRFGKTSAFKLL